MKITGKPAGAAVAGLSLVLMAAPLCAQQADAPKSFRATIRTKHQARR